MNFPKARITSFVTRDTSCCLQFGGDIEIHILANTVINILSESRTGKNLDINGLSIYVSHHRLHQTWPEIFPEVPAQRCP